MVANSGKPNIEDYRRTLAISEVRFTAITDISDPRISIRIVPRANVAKIYWAGSTRLRGRLWSPYSDTYRASWSSKIALSGQGARISPP
jgi:hypothetical protein